MLTHPYSFAKHQDDKCQGNVDVAHRKVPTTGRQNGIILISMTFDKIRKQMQIIPSNHRLRTNAKRRQTNIP